MVVSKTEFPTPDEVLPGRAEKIQVAEKHFVNGNALVEPFPQGMALAMFGMGCFWGAEKVFWQHNGVYSTQVGYSGGTTPNATYKEVCSGLTGHAEVVRVVYDPKVTTYEALLNLFWDNHDPTQGMKQDIDVGTQYRSAVYYYDEDQRSAAENSAREFQKFLDERGLGVITTEIKEASEFYYAEDNHQQYLAKNTGESCSGGVCLRKAKQSSNSATSDTTRATN